MKSQRSVNFAKTFIEGEFHLGVWGFVKKIFSFIDSFFILRSLSLYQYGLYQLLLSLYAIVSDTLHDLFGSVVPNDIARHISQDDHRGAKRLFFEYSVFRISLGVIPAIVGIVAASFITFRYGPDAVYWVRLLSLLFVVEALLQVVTTFFSVHLEFKILAFRPSLQKLMQGLFLAYFYFFSVLTIKEIFYSMIFAPLAVLIFLIPSFFRVYSKWKSVPMAPRGILMRNIRSYGIWEVPQVFTKNLVGKIRPWLIKLFLSTEAVGIFGIASTAISILKDVIPTRTLTALVPHKAASPEGMRTLFIYGTKYYVLLSAVVTVLGLVVYPIGINLLFPHMKSSIILFYSLAPTIVLFAFIKLTNVFLVVRRRQKFIFFNSLFQHGLGVISILLFVPVFGLVGLGIAEFFAILVSVIIKYAYLTRTKFIEKMFLNDFFTFGQMDKEIMNRLKTHVLHMVGRQ